MKKHSEIDWIFFDVGGVLADNFAFEEWRVKSILLATNKFDSNITEAEVRKSIIEASGILGSLSKNTVRLLLKKEEENIIAQAEKETEKEMKIIWDTDFKVLSVIRPEALDIVSELSKEYSLGIIANQAIEVKEKLEKAKLLKYFKNLGISEKHGFHKPDPKLFEIVLSESGADPKRSVMIDDNIDRGLAPAMKFGMKTVWYDLGTRKYAPDWIDFKIKNLKDLINIF